MSWESASVSPAFRNIEVSLDTFAKWASKTRKTWASDTNYWLRFKPSSKCPEWVQFWRQDHITIKCYRLPNQLTSVSRPSMLTWTLGLPTNAFRGTKIAARIKNSIELPVRYWRFVDTAIWAHYRDSGTRQATPVSFTAWAKIKLNVPNAIGSIDKIESRGHAASAPLWYTTKKRWL